MEIKKSLLLGIMALTLGVGVSATTVSANHNFFY